jgi:hypothetical protein
MIGNFLEKLEMMLAERHLIKLQKPLDSVFREAQYWIVYLKNMSSIQIFWACEVLEIFCSQCLFWRQPV